MAEMLAMRDPAIGVGAQAVVNMDSAQFEARRLFTPELELMQQYRGIQPPLNPTNSRR